MPHGAEARKRKWKERQKAKRRAQKTEGSSVRLRQSRMGTAASCAPSITEHDLLSFHYTHFAHTTRPQCFFVGAEDVVGFDVQHLRGDNDGLGYYEDGTKRTLTDEQIAMFKHSEIQQLTRDARLREHEEGDASLDAQQEDDGAEGARSPASEASSVEGDLVGLARPAPQPPSLVEGKVQRLQRSRGDTPRSTASTQRQHRRQEVPYDQRHKRKWEDYIEENDPEQGSLTHRRLVRELDEQIAQEVDMDYGEGPSMPAERIPDLVKPSAPPGRRVVSYADD